MDGVTHTSKVCRRRLPGAPCLPETGSSCYPRGHVFPSLCSAPFGIICSRLSLPAPAGCAPRPLGSPFRVLEAGLLLTQLLALGTPPSLVQGTSSWADDGS